MNSGTFSFPRSGEFVSAKNPSQISSSTIRAWYDFSSPLNTIVGNKISVLYDLSGNSRHITQSTDSSRATLGTLNTGEVCGIFAGSQIYDSGYTSSDLFASLYIIFSINQNQNNYSFIAASRSDGPDTKGVGIYINGTSPQNIPQSDFSFTKFLPINENNLLSTGGTSAPNDKVILGIQQNWESKTGAISFKIGGSNSSRFTGKISEVVLLGGNPLTNTDYLSMNRYFIDKYNLY